VFQSALDDQGYVRFSPQAMNMVASGTPGFGPMVSIGMMPFVKAHPELEESLKTVFPFGVPNSVTEALIPPNIRRATIAAGDDDAAAYRNAFARIAITKMVKMQNGDIGMVDMNDPEARSKFLAEVDGEAKSFAGMRFVTGLLSPVPLQFDTPFQPMIDAYRKRRAQDPEGADEWFLDEYGEEFFALTQAFTKVNDGIPPTLKGEQARDKYVDLVERFPELGSLIIGTEGGGSAVQFSSAAYAKQLSAPVRGGSADRRRVRLSPDDIAVQPSVRLGWIKFSRAMDTIEAIQSQRGLPNLFSKDGEDLRILRSLAITALAKEHPDWYKEYSVRDEAKWDKRMTGMREIVKDERLSGRPDISGLKEYLTLRDSIVGFLQSREHHSLSATDNQDIRAVWETMVSRMKEKSLAFSDLYHRWLENDPVAPDLELV
jgi:hypothetical protein